MKVIKEAYFKTVINSKGKVVVLFNYNYLIKKDVLDYTKEYISKPNINKVHLVFDEGFYNAGSPKFVINWFKSILRVIYKSNPNVRVIIHAHTKIKSTIDNLYIKKRDIHYVPRIVYDIDQSKPLYFGIGYDNYVEIVSKSDRFELSYVDSTYFKEGK